MNMKRFAVSAPRPCRTVAALLVPYAENTLSASARARVCQHLDGCPSCRAEVETLARMTTVLRDATPPAPVLDAQLWSRLEREISAPAPWYRGPLAPVWGAVAMASVVGLGFFALRPAPPTGAAMAQAKPVVQRVTTQPLASAMAQAQGAASERGRVDPFAPVSVRPRPVVAKMTPTTPRRVQVASLRVRRRHLLPVAPVMVAALPVSPAPPKAHLTIPATVPAATVVSLAADSVTSSTQAPPVAPVMVAYAPPSEPTEATLVRDSPPAMSMAEVGGADRRRSALFSYTAR